MNKKMFIKGAKDAIPIGLGYLAVAFSLGISAANAGLTPMQAFISAIVSSSSTGQYAGYQVIHVGGTLLEITFITLIANARYALMSSAIAQRLHPDIPEQHRYLMALGVTDEIFALTINQEGYLNPYREFNFLVGCGNNDWYGCWCCSPTKYRIRIICLALWDVYCNNCT